MFGIVWQFEQIMFDVKRMLVDNFQAFSDNKRLFYNVVSKLVWS